MGSVISSANLLSSVFSRRKKLETPPLPLPLRGGERLPPEREPHATLLNSALELSGYRRRRIPVPTAISLPKFTGNYMAVYLKLLFCMAESMSGWRSPPLKGRGRGGVSNFLSASLLSSVYSQWKKLQSPPLPRLRPTVASLPNCSGLAIAFRGGERLPPEREPHVPSLEPCT